MLPWAHPSPNPKRHVYISIGSGVFAHLAGECPYTLQWVAFPPQNCPFSWGIWTPSKSDRPTWFPELTRVLNSNDISIGSAVLHSSLLYMTDTPTNHATRPETIGRIYVRSRLLLRCGLIIVELLSRLVRNANTVEAQTVLELTIHLRCRKFTLHALLVRGTANIQELYCTLNAARRRSACTKDVSMFIILWFGHLTL